MTTWFDNWVMWMDAYCHSLGFHFYTLPAVAAGFLALLMGLIHWRNQEKRNEESKEKRQDTLNSYLTTGEGAFH